jgi:hypothetical protein
MLWALAMKTARIANQEKLFADAELLMHRNTAVKPNMALICSSGNSAALLSRVILSERGPKRLSVWGW